jgi:small subunit ribosomal protein S20
LANIKSQIKRNKQNEKRRLRNRVFRGTARIAVREARSTLESGDPEQSKQAVLAAVSALDKAAEKGVLHKKNASRRKGRLMKRLFAMGTTDTKPVKGDAPVGTEAEPAKKAAPKKAAPKKAPAKTAKKPAAAKKPAKKPAATKATKKTTATKATSKTAAKKTTKK